MSLRRLIIYSTLSCAISLSAHQCAVPEPETIHVGNFALPSSQQPSTLYGFGQYITQKGDCLLAVASDTIIGHANNNANVMVPYLIYGILDDLAMVVALPFAARLNDRCSSSSGFLDGYIELEYLAYGHHTEIDCWEVSIIGSLFLPFGNANKTPPTGFGSPSFFAGQITRYMSTKWYWYFSTGAIFMTPHHNTRFGHEFLYQTGVGINLGYEADVWICTLMLEMNGMCALKQKDCGVLNPNTGGNQVAFGPTIWFSTQRFIFQAGILPVLYQHWNGNQANNTLLLSLNFEWKF